MKINLAWWDRSLRFLSGVLLTAWAVAGGPWWAYVGTYLIMTASWGMCPAYTMIKIRTYQPRERGFLPPE